MSGTKKHIVVITRRQFVKMMVAGGAALGLGNISLPKWAQAALDKPAVVWFEGQDCAGCTESVLATLTPDPRDVVIDVVNIRYHETIMAGSGYTAEAALDDAIADGGYVMVLEGSLPAADPRYMEVAGHALETKVVQAANAAAAIIAIGACGCYGGIPRAGVTDGQGMEYFIDQHNITTPLVNLPGCPVHPKWFYDTVLYFINNGSLPALDDDLRPLNHFGGTIHDRCPRKGNYNKGLFLTDWNDANQAGYCLLMKGCKGPVTHADCRDILWNDGTSYCIQNNAPCAGCTERLFYHELSPLFGQTVSQYDFLEE
jgi:hydrogenase small subunit